MDHLKWTYWMCNGEEELSGLTCSKSRLSTVISIRVIIFNLLPPNMHLHFRKDLILQRVGCNRQFEKPLLTPMEGEGILNKRLVHY